MKVDTTAHRPLPAAFDLEAFNEWLTEQYTRRDKRRNKLDGMRDAVMVALARERTGYRVKV